MIVYHGSNAIVERPDVDHSFRYLDFGRGFYATTLRKQAEIWARRKATLAKGSVPFLNVYEMEENVGDFIVKNFGDDLDAWIDFVCLCREGDEGYKQYDVIMGKVANDKVFRVVDMYHNGVWDKDRALREIGAYPNYDQIAFIRQEALDRLLKFKTALEARNEG